MRFHGPLGALVKRAAQPAIQSRAPIPEGGEDRVSKVRVKPDESFEKALRRFKKKCNKEGIMQRLKEMRHYEKPSEKRRRKLAKAIARQASEKRDK